MSDCWMNIRFGIWHVKWKYDAWIPRLSRNTYWIEKTPRFQIHELRSPW